LQRRWCSVDSISMYPIGQLWLSRSSKIIDRLWLYCQLWVILFTLTYLTIGRKERYLSKLGQSTISKIEMSQPCFCMMQFWVWVLFLEHCVVRSDDASIDGESDVSAFASSRFERCSMGHSA
jgi:hypothetical protein